MPTPSFYLNFNAESCAPYHNDDVWGDRAELISLAEELNISDSVCFMGKQKNPCDYIRGADLYV